MSKQQRRSAYLSPALSGTFVLFTFCMARRKTIPFKLFIHSKRTLLKMFPNSMLKVVCRYCYFDLSCYTNVHFDPLKVQVQMFYGQQKPNFNSKSEGNITFKVSQTDVRVSARLSRYSYLEYLCEENENRLNLLGIKQFSVT